MHPGHRLRKQLWLDGPHWVPGLVSSVGRRARHSGPAPSDRRAAAEGQSIFPAFSAMHLATMRMASVTTLSVTSGRVSL